MCEKVKKRNKRKQYIASILAIVRRSVFLWLLLLLHMYSFLSLVLYVCNETISTIDIAQNCTILWVTQTICHLTAACIQQHLSILQAQHM